MKQKKFIPIIAFISILSAFLIVTSVLSQTKSGGGVNLVKEEMIALDPAFKKIILCLAVSFRSK